MKAAWPSMSIEDACERLIDYRGKTPTKSEAGIRLVTAKVVKRGRINDDRAEYISQAEYDRWMTRGIPQKSDVLLTTEAPLGEIAILRTDEPIGLAQRIILLRANREVLDPYFLLYALGTPLMQGRLKARASGTTVIGIKNAELRKVQIPTPPLLIQSRIGAILSAYDDLIENNRRRIQLLEQAARLLYKEWFVHLRFPGHEHVKITDGVPEGWERRTLGDCADFLSGGTPRKSNSEFWSGDIPWVSSGELTTMRIHRTALNITDDAVKSGSRLVAPETILAVVRGMSLAKEFRIGVVARHLAFNQDIKAIVAKPDLDSLYLFHAIDAQRNAIRDRAGDASHGTKKLPTPVLAEVKVMVPTSSLQSLFREVVGTLHRQWDVLDNQTVQLHAARDLLLPRLMTGEIAI